MANAFISIISDYGFKVTFGNAADTLFLRVALQALTLDSRAGIYDVACTAERGS